MSRAYFKKCPLRHVFFGAARRRRAALRAAPEKYSHRIFIGPEVLVCVVRRCNTVRNDGLGRLTERTKTRNRGAISVSGKLSGATARGLLRTVIWPPDISMRAHVEADR